MDFARFCDNPCLFFGRRSGRGKSVLAHFDADGKTELVISRQWRQPCACRCQAGEAGAELCFQVDRGRSGSSIGQRNACLGGILLSILKGGVNLPGGHAGEARQIERISFEGLVGTERRNNDADSGDCALQDFGSDRDRRIIDVVTHLRVTGLPDRIIVRPDREERCSRVD